MGERDRGCHTGKDKKTDGSGRKRDRDGIENARLKESGRESGREREQ